MSLVGYVVLTVFFNSVPCYQGVLHEDLKVFLETNVPKSSKKLKVLLGVSDPRIAAAIFEELQIHCMLTGAVPELLRGKCKWMAVLFSIALCRSSMLRTSFS